MNVYLVTDTKYGNLTVIKCLGNPSIRKSRWELECDCGNICTASADNVLRGRTIRCHGCVIRLRAHNQSITLTNILANCSKANNTKHELYRVWAQIIQRCTNQNNRWYHRYGGRGIKVCSIWLKDFRAYANYIDTVLGKRPSEIHSLDRINNNGDYEEGNLKWSTPTEQANNRNVI